jgi:hypothetical protein
MTGPTAVTPSPHDLPANFAYHPSYDEAISYIAQSDDVSALDNGQDLDWPTLKNAIKSKISDILAGFPENPEPLLHPAARKRPTNGSEVQSSSDGSTSTSQGAAMALASRFSSAASTSRNGRAGSGIADDSSSDESDLLEDSNSAPISGPSAEGDDSAGSVTSTFMAAKTRPPPERYGSWGRRLSKEETAREKLMVFGMLDEFDR